MKDYNKENLDVTHYRNGDPIPFVKSKKQWEALTTGAYCYYDNDPEKGVLYNWHAVNDSRGLAPEGWKIPTIKELEQIDLTIGLPGCYRDYNGNFSNIGNLGYWWSSTESNTDNACYRYLNYDYRITSGGLNSKDYGFSVRCLKDETLINKINNMEVVIDGIVYVPKELEKKVEPVIVEEHFKFELHPAKSNDKLNWDDAVAYAKSLGDGWRLPTVEECFIMCNNKVMTEGTYWSGSEYNNLYTWGFGFSDCDTNYFFKSVTCLVRAVRSI